MWSTNRLVGIDYIGIVQITVQQIVLIHAIVQSCILVLHVWALVDVGLVALAASCILVLIRIGANGRHDYILHVVID